MKYIITGTSSGLGYFICKKLLAHGEVAGISRRIKSSSELENYKYHHIKFDLSKSNSTLELPILINKLINFINNDNFMLILNASIFYLGDKRLDNDQCRNMFEVNLFSIMNLVNSLKLPNLRRIFIINSISGLIGQKNQHEYTASKHAVMGFARSLAKEAKNSTYDIITINPGGMKTELWQNFKSVDDRDFLSPEIVADICVSLLLVPERIFIEQMTILPASDL